MTSPVPSTTGLYCPVCGSAVDSLWVWQEPAADQARVFCAQCASTPDYRGLREEECRRLDDSGFYRWAGQRILRHVFEKEHAEA